MQFKKCPSPLVIMIIPFEQSLGDLAPPNKKSCLDISIQSLESTMSDDSNNSDESTKSDQSIKSDKSFKSDDSMKSDESFKSDQSLKIDEFIKSNESIKSDESSKSEESLKIDESIKSDKSTRSDESIKPDESDENGIDKTKSGDKFDQVESELEAMFAGMSIIYLNHYLVVKFLLVHGIIFVF